MLLCTSTLKITGRHMRLLCSAVILFTSLTILILLLITLKDYVSLRPIFYTELRKVSPTVFALANRLRKKAKLGDDIKFFVVYSPIMLRGPAFCLSYSKEIYLNRFSLDNPHLTVILAHELGHIFYPGKEECFANRFAVNLCGKKKVVECLTYLGYPSQSVETLL